MAAPTSLLFLCAARLTTKAAKKGAALLSATKLILISPQQSERNAARVEREAESDVDRLLELTTPNWAGGHVTRLSISNYLAETTF